MINTNQKGFFNDNEREVLEELIFAFQWKHLDPNNFPKLDELTSKLEEKRQAIEPSPWR